jgi:hypothetical protein
VCFRVISNKSAVKLSDFRCFLEDFYFGKKFLCVRFLGVFDVARLMVPGSRVNHLNYEMCERSFKQSYNSSRSIESSSLMHEFQDQIKLKASNLKAIHPDCHQLMVILNFLLYD